MGGQMDGRADGEQSKIGENRSPAVSHLLADLGWVDFYLGSSSLQIEINLRIRFTSI